MLILFIFCMIQSAFSAENPFRLEIIEPQGQEQQIGFVIVVPPNHHVYRDMLSIKVKDDGGLNFGSIELPAGEFVADPAKPESFRELYESSPKIELGYSGKIGEYTSTFEITYQGCRAGLCYPPVTENQTLDLEVFKNADKNPQSVGPPVADFSSLEPSAVVEKVGADGKAHPVIARLILDSASIKPGDTFRVGVHLEQKEGWHTYWKSPGDIGKPTEIEWTMPEGFMASDYQYPLPHRYEDSGIVSYGYDDQVLFFSEVDVPKDLTENTIEIKADVHWLVCLKQCIPGNAQLKVNIPVKNERSAASDFQPLFDYFADQHPTPATEIERFSIETGVSVSAVSSEKPFQFALYLNPMGGESLAPVQDVGTWPLVTPIINGQYFITNTEVTKTPEGGVLVIFDAETYEVFELPENESIGALIQLEEGGDWIRTEAEMPLSWVENPESVVKSNSPLFTNLTSIQPEAELMAKTDGEGSEANFFAMLLAAFIGGFILNGMPCVLPVLTIKFYSLSGKAGESRNKQILAAISYSAGVLISFLFLALCIVVLRSSFEIPVGWGFQFQYPEFVVPLATVVFVFGLSLFGVFEVPAFGASSAENISNRDGQLGHFLTGVFTTLLATPCSAPFLGTGMGFAFSLPTSGLFLFFAVAGLGLAFPFLLVAFFPSTLRFLPKPGAWMNTFKIVMGFTLMATTVWLIDVVGALLGQDGTTGFLSFLMVVAFACWVLGNYGSELESGRRQLSVLGIALLLSFLGGYQFLTFEIPETVNLAKGEVQESNLDFETEVPWQPFSDEAVTNLNHRILFIDFTADWCLSCKVNEKTILSTEKVRMAMKEHDVVPLKADWTRRDAEITAWLERYERAGVPFYIVIPPNGAPAIPLGEIITPGMVVDALAKAAGK